MLYLAADTELPEVSETIKSTPINAWESTLAHTPNLAAGPVILLEIWLVAKLVRAIFRRSLKRSNPARRCRFSPSHPDRVASTSGSLGGQSWWTKSKSVDVRRSRGEAVTSVKKAPDAAGIEIPFPYRTLTFKEPLALAKVDSGGTEES